MPKAGSAAGRTVFDASIGKGSLNAHADKERMGLEIPLMPNPLIQDIADMAMDQRAYHGENVQLTGGTCDVRTAFEQYFHRAGIPLLFGTIVDILDDQGIERRVVVAFVGGCFGFTRSGYAYGEIQRFIDYRHNVGRPIRWSRTYVDDGMFICPTFEINECTSEYQSAVAKILGVQAVQDEKTEIFKNKHIAIGWELDFERWVVLPRERARRKLLYRWWVCMPDPREGLVAVKDLITAISSSTHHAQAIRMENAFLPSLRRILTQRPQRFVPAMRNVVVHRKTGMIKIAGLALSDFLWMRAIVWISAMKPELVTRSINYVSTRSRGEYYMVTDASTSVGGGGTIAQMRTDQTPGAIIRTGIIRWCKFAEMTAKNNYN